MLNLGKVIFFGTEEVTKRSEKNEANLPTLFNVFPKLKCNLTYQKGSLAIKIPFQTVTKHSAFKKCTKLTFYVWSISLVPNTV